MIEFLNSLTWPAAFATVASVVSIITGLFGYVISSRKKAEQKVIDQTPTAPNYEKLHARINDVIARVAANEGDHKEARASLRGLQQQLFAHEQRDIDDFKLIDAKVDRLMDIVVRLLQDDKL